MGAERFSIKPYYSYQDHSYTSQMYNKPCVTGFEERIERGLIKRYNEKAI